MLMLLGLALPLAILGFGLSGGSDNDDEDMVTLDGTDDADRLEGDEGSDFISGNGGDDILIGNAGNDTLLGHEGDDVLEGANGDDMLCSGDGDDVVFGNVGHDLLEGQEGNDFLSGDYGFDSIFGNEGDDIMVGGRGGDLVNGNDGDDLVFGGIIENLPLNLQEMTALRDGGSLAELNGGIEMRDDSVGNELWGGAGDDNLILGSGDVADGNSGADTYHIMSEQNGNVAPVISSYIPDQDAITVIVRDVDADADISVTDEGEDAIIRMGDTILARVSGAAGTLATADVTLIAESTVTQLFDPNGVAA
jgi:Ca2+-binding RTX toxin-like protein